MRLHLISLGCPKNLVDSEKILGALGASGIVISASPQDSDVIVINTCGFIKPAMEETEEEIAKALKNNGNKQIYVIGCAVNRAAGVLKKKYPEVAGWFTLEQEMDFLHKINPKSININSRLSTTQGYAYLKIADGCSNHCSYCTIPLIKGEYHSYDFDELINETMELSKLGIREIILIAQDTTRYGFDKYNKPMLIPLIREISKIPAIEWIRIMYVHPKTMSEDVISEIESNKKVCTYIDLPIQHINNRILKLMNRGVDRNRIVSIIKRLKKVKGISLRTTVIAGFPTETDDEFKELFNFVQEVNFDWLGVFPYSCEKGTRASKLEQLPESIIAERYKTILKLQRKTIQKHNKERIGQVYKTLIHCKNRNYMGHTEFAAPEIDSQVIAQHRKLKIGQFYNLKIMDLKGADLYGNPDLTD